MTNPVQDGTHARGSPQHIREVLPLVLADLMKQTEARQATTHDEPEEEDEDVDTTRRACPATQP